MECNNKLCIFNAFDQCCHESEEGFNNAKLNSLYCPSSLRVDLQENMYKAMYYIEDNVKNKTHKELMEICNLMERQLKNR